MGRPDEHPELAAMGPGQATCDVCVMKYFPNQPDSICNDCGLNPVEAGNEASLARFVEECFDHEEGMTLDELRERQKKLQPPR